MKIKGKTFSVLGAARSGVAVAKLLKSQGAAVFVSDSGSEEKHAAEKAELLAAGIAFEFGENSPRVLDAETIVMSPGVPSTAPVVQQALVGGKRVVSELEVASWFCRAPMIAVTGTNGKTTTTTLLGAMFQDAGREAVVAGNIGTAFSAVVSQTGPRSVAILEVSSFQLDHVDTFEPKVSLILNFTPDHLDRYEHSYEKYVAAKCRIFARQRDGDLLVYNADDSEVSARVLADAHPSIRKLAFSAMGMPAEGAGVVDGKLVISVRDKRHDIIPVGEIGIPGRHNLYNAMAASLAAFAMGVPAESLRQTLATFKGVEHRLEFVRIFDGVTYINDSKGTNVDSVWYALQSYSAPIVLLLGGRDKGNDYRRLYTPVKEHVKAIVAIGESAEKVINAFEGRVPLTKADTMESAVEAARRLAKPGDIVLLSPACASFDWFTSYEHRGKVFKQIVMNLGEGSRA